MGSSCAIAFTGLPSQGLTVRIGETLPVAERKELVIYSNEERVDTLARNPEFMGHFDLTHYRVGDSGLEIVQRYEIMRRSSLFPIVDRVMREAKL